MSIEVGFSPGCGKRLTARAGSGVMESLQQHRAGVDNVAAGQDDSASLHGGVAVGLIMTATVVFITVGFRHCGKLPQLRVEIASVVSFQAMSV